jgi:ubiquinone/menaquinone biosynthesis C-methylase UbiE
MTAVKAYKGLGMNGMVAKWYATNAGKRADQYKAWADRAAKIAPGPEVLEVAPGPGLFSIELAQRGLFRNQGTFRITGLDISETFVEIARKNAAEAGVSVDFQHGNASQMPFPDNRFDFIFCSAAFKNFAEPVEALREMFRVLRPGGKALIGDLRKDASREDINHLVDQFGEGAISKAFTKLTFRTMLLKRAYTRAQLMAFVAQSGFGPAEISEESVGIELLLTK